MSRAVEVRPVQTVVPRSAATDPRAPAVPAGRARGRLPDTPRRRVRIAPPAVHRKTRPRPTGGDARYAPAARHPCCFDASRWRIFESIPTQTKPRQAHAASAPMCSIDAARPRAPLRLPRRARRHRPCDGNRPAAASVRSGAIPRHLTAAASCAWLLARPPDASSRRYRGRPWRCTETSGAAGAPALASVREWPARCRAARRRVPPPCR